HLLQSFVGVTDVLKLDVKDRINQMFVSQGSKAILPSEARNDRAVVKSLLTIEVELAGPPALDAIFEFSPIGEKTIRDFRHTHDQIRRNFQAPSLFHVVAVGHEINVVSPSGQRTDQSG